MIDRACPLNFEEAEQAGGARRVERARVPVWVGGGGMARRSEMYIYPPFYAQHKTKRFPFHDLFQKTQIPDFQNCAMKIEGKSVVQCVGTIRIISGVNTFAIRHYAQIWLA